ncbi:hypothetical protein EZ428_07820 [Pedobacter frigiditerrae]|uniref:DUF4384 domain-containing protein n=1 Tax=Pedobacter frigiditerrae TaxID=2530452 RepID=A0A4R0MWM3_9SPHI|nr:caspase family protein [Pedobacter frigiditerrae]TCC91659.1 hypothetical protein EZ428_07820 [Pedobacter frigiditerrae]
MKLKLTFGLLILFFAVGTVTAQKKHALIFAIGDYPESGGWSKISSAQDVGYIKNTLAKQGFPANNVKVVADSVATKEGIKAAFENLISNVGKKDVVVIHVSSHGEQVADDNDDEADGYDETIVSYNATLAMGADKTAIARGTLSKAEYEKLQANYFRDDEFGAYIQRLRAALGNEGDVVVFMDNCHSGSGTRGSAQTRGGKPALVYSGFDRKFRKEDGEEVFKESTASRGNDKDLATYVVVSAALASELNFETTGDDNVGMGSLTYAISKVFENLKAGTTYRTLFANIQAIMNEKVPGQHPVLEGNGLDRTLFGGAFVDQKPFIDVEKINTPLEILVKAGSFAGLSVGAKVNIYPAGTIDPSKAVALAKGVVIKATNYKATIKLDKITKLTQPSQMYVFISEPLFSTKPIVVGFSPKSRGNTAYTAEETAQITAALKKLPLVSLVGEPELLIVKGQGRDTISIATNGYRFTDIPTATDTVALKGVINRYAQYKLLEKLVVKDSTIMAQVKLIPVVDGKPDEAAMKAKFDDRTYNFVDGDKVMLWIKNTGKKAVYVNILDLQPNGIINTFLPNKEQEIYPGDLRIEPGQTRIFDKYEIELGEPFGTEVLKVFVTSKEINLEGLATPKASRGDTGKKGVLSILEGLVDQSSTSATRGPKVVSVKEAEGSVYNILYTLKEKQ